MRYVRRWWPIVASLAAIVLFAQIMAISSVTHGATLTWSIDTFGVALLMGTVLAIYIYELRKAGIIVFALATCGWFAIALGYTLMGAEFSAVDALPILTLPTLALSVVAILWALWTALFNPDRSSISASSRLTLAATEGLQLRHVFQQVWYRPEENRWRKMELIAFNDIGRLNVYDNALEFIGREVVVIKAANRIMLGKQGRDSWNVWIKIEYESTVGLKTAYFMDGRWLGWSGFFGGTKKMFEGLDAALHKSKEATK